MILSGDGGFLVRGECSDAEFLAIAEDYVGRPGHRIVPSEACPIAHGWYRWVPDLDEGGVLLYGAKEHARGAFRAVVMDCWHYEEADHADD
jgi:hypothetical protein